MGVPALMRISRRLRRATATVALTLLAVPLLSTFGPVAGAGPDLGGSTFRVMGELPEPVGALRNSQKDGTIVGVDAKRRLLFYTYTDIDGTVHLVTYDLRTPIPHQIRTSVLGSLDNQFPTILTTYNVAYDSTRQRLAFLAPSLDANGNPIPAHLPSLVVFDTVAGRKVVVKNFGTIVPGYFPMGISYSAKDDVYYTVGEFTGHEWVADGTTVVGGKFTSPGNGVVSLSATAFTMNWERSVAQCPQILYSKKIGSFVARSTDQDALYFACVSGGSAAGQTWPQESGLVRLHIKPHGSSADQLLEQQEFFPISGSYYAGGKASGVAAFDPITERFYLQSLSFGTPGTFVFDGRLSAWVGFVAAPIPTNAFIGLNPGLGHLYLGMWDGSQGGDHRDGLLVADVRQTPVPAGDERPIIPGSLIETDPLSNRLFVRPITSSSHYLVIQDLTAVTKPGTVIEDNPDAETAGLPDVPANAVDFVGDATGYGAQVVQVGGTSAPMTATGTLVSKVVPNAFPNTRAAMAARAGFVDLRPGSAAASSQAFVVDSNTTKDYETADYDKNKKRDFGNWPYDIHSCLNQDGKAQTYSGKAYFDKNAQYQAGQPVPGNDSSSVTCNAAGLQASANTTVTGSSTAGVDVANAHYDASAVRTLKDGLTVRSTALASGVTFALPGSLKVTIGKVTATTVSVAHGRAGTATSDWYRTVEGVSVTDANGSPLPLPTTGCTTHLGSRNGALVTKQDGCVALADNVNKLTQMRFHLTFPMANVMSTPKGAFAGVEQTDADYYQQNNVNDQGIIYRDDSVGIRPVPAVMAEVYTDTAERSRTVVLLAATQSDAKFTVSPPFKDVPSTDVPPPSGTSFPTGTTTVTPGTPGTTGGTPTQNTPATQAPVAVNHPVTDLSGFLFLRRGMRDILLLLLLSGLVLGGGGTAIRRRRLVDVLVTVPGKEAV